MRSWCIKGDQWLEMGQLANTCVALGDLAPYTEFQKREKHPWGSVTFSKVLLADLK